MPPSIESLPLVLVVAAPNDPDAGALVMALRQMGVNAALADTAAAVVEQAPRALACGVLLRPATKDDPAVTTVATMPGIRTIPLFGEQMLLPFGYWGASPIFWQGASLTAQRMMAVVATPPGVPAPLLASPAVVSLSERRRRNTLRDLGIVGGILALVVVFVGVMGIAGKRIIGNIGTSSASSSYSAAAPGPSCDHGSATWQTDTTVVPQNLACTSAGLQITYASSEVLGEIFFRPPSLSFPASYRVETDATIVSGDYFAGVGIIVHNQANSAGGQSFLVRGNTGWYSYSYDTNGQIAARLATGFLSGAPQRSFHLRVDVAGPQLIFWINGSRVGSAMDATYSSTDEIALAVSSNGVTPIVAVFSHFVYTPLTDATTLSGEQTATAVAASHAPGPYTARVPGLGCDAGGGVWSNPVAYDDQQTTVACTSKGLALARPPDRPDDSDVGFYWLGADMPNNYRLDVRVSLITRGVGCAGFHARESSQGNLRLLVCTNGSWFLDRFISSGASYTRTALGSGSIAAQSSYGVTLTVQGATITVKVNGRTIVTARDATLTQTSDVTLCFYSNGGGDATFSSFTFTPLS